MSETTLHSGSELAHYRIVASIGAGGMGEVYEAHDQKLQRGVALKILPPQLVANQDRVRRFVQEARSASGLSHPHIVTIHDIGEARLPIEGSSGSSIHYIAMELIRGKSLREKLHDERCELRDAVRWLSQAAEGLAKAHGAGIIHRDLKPDNIMITADGYAKVLDFGLAKLTQRGDSDAEDATQVRDETGEGVVVGTVAYMSPEQVQGKKIDPRSDIFSLGCILFEAATGEKPFPGTTNVDVMHNILHQRAPAVHELNPSVPGELRKLIRRCLAKDPDKRVQSMKDLAIELAEMYDEWDSLASEGSVSSGSKESLAPVVMRDRRWIIAAITALLAIAGAAYFVMRRAPEAPAAAPVMTFAPLTNMAGVEMYPTISPDGSYVAYHAYGGDDLDVFLLRVGGRNPINLTELSPAEDGQPAFSPDGQTIAFRSSRDGGGIFVMGATGESVRRLTDTGYFPAWSPDGKQIVYCTDLAPVPYGRNATSELWVVDATTGEKKKIYAGDAVHPRFSPDGARIAFWGLSTFNSGQRDIGTITADGKAMEWVTTDAALDWRPVWSPDGRSIYFSSDRGGSLNLWTIAIDPKSGKAIGAPRPLTTPSRAAGELDLSKDGTKLVFNSWDDLSNIARLSVDPKTMMPKGAHALVTRGGELLIESDVSPDGEWLVARTSGTREDLVLMKSDGSQRRQLTDDATRDRGPRWSPDGKWIFFYSARNGPYEYWRIRPDGSGLQQLSKSSADSPWFPVLSPDGTKLTGFNEHGTFLFDATGTFPTARVEHLPPLASDRVFLGSDWSLDGKEIVGLGSATGAVAYDALVSWNVAARRYTTLLETPATNVIWVPGERRVVYAYKRAIYLFDPATRKASRSSSFRIAPSDGSPFRATAPRSTSRSPRMNPTCGWARSQSNGRCC